MTISERAKEAAKHCLEAKVHSPYEAIIQAAMDEARDTVMDGEVVPSNY